MIKIRLKYKWPRAINMIYLINQRLLSCKLKSPNSSVILWYISCHFFFYAVILQIPLNGLSTHVKHWLIEEETNIKMLYVQFYVICTSFKISNGQCTKKHFIRHERSNDRILHQHLHFIKTQVTAQQWVYKECFMIPDVIL